jgi:hypothetical protein
MAGKRCLPHRDREEAFVGEEKMTATRFNNTASSGGAPMAEGRALLSGEGRGKVWCECKEEGKGSGSTLNRGREEGEGEAGKGRRPAHLPLMAGGAAA